MSDTPPHDLDALTASLRADAADSVTFFHVFAAKLLDAMPDSVEVEREGGLFKKEHPPKRVTVRVGEDSFEARLDGRTIRCRHAHAVRGITLRSEEPDFDTWLRGLVDALAAAARSSAAANAALQSLVS